ncbi:jg11983, partial [Pararge aegeria aegeria]
KGVGKKSKSAASASSSGVPECVGVAGFARSPSEGEARGEAGDGAYSRLEVLEERLAENGTARTRRGASHRVSGLSYCTGGLPYE